MSGAPTARRSTHARILAALFGIRSFSVRTSPAAVLNLSTGLLCLVAVGNTETVMRRDCSRGAPSAGFDSIVVPGRRLPSQAGTRDDSGANPAGHARFNEEYVVFDGSQVLPLCLLEYTVRS